MRNPEVLGGGTGAQYGHQDDTKAPEEETGRTRLRRIEKVGMGGVATGAFEYMHGKTKAVYSMVHGAIILALPGAAIKGRTTLEHGVPAYHGRDDFLSEVADYTFRLPKECRQRKERQDFLRQLLEAYNAQLAGVRWEAEVDISEDSEGFRPSFNGWQFSREVLGGVNCMEGGRSATPPAGRLAGGRVGVAASRVA